MQILVRLFKYLKNYQSFIALNIVCNILMVVFSLVSIPTLIPFLQILFGKEPPRLAAPAFSWNAESIKENFYYQLSQLIEHNGREQALIAVCFLIAGCFFFKNLFRYLSLFFITPVRNGIVRDLRQALFEKTLRLPLSYFSDERKGDLMSRVSTDVQEIEWSILNVIEAIVREPLMIIGSISYMIFLSPTLTLFVVVLLLFTGIIIGGIGKTLKKQSSAVQEKLGDLTSVLEEALSGTRIIKAFNAEKYQNQKFERENNELRRLQTLALRRRDMSSPITEFLGIAVVCVLVWFGFKRVEAGDMSAEGFITFLFAFYSVIDPAKSFSAAWSNVAKGRAALDRVDMILLAPEIISNPLQATPLSTFAKNIEFKNVSFKYQIDNQDFILKNLNLTIPKGKSIALVGASGAGKSTIVDLIPRFYDPTEGGVLIDGIDIRQFNLSDLRSLMGIVTQEALLFNDTIENNLLFGLENISREQMIQAAQMANAHDFIEQTENRYQTMIGDRGSKLSGGQRQRLTIARALLRNPEILIFDEATSALDAESEQLVQIALEQLMRGRTAVIIAHRLATVRHADEIIVLSKGEIIERGKHDDLIAQNGEYAKLVQMQGLH